MPNPNPGEYTTGHYATREQLQAAIIKHRSIDLNWTEIAELVGVSPRTAKRVHEEAEAAIKAAREAAYDVAARAEHAAEEVAATTGLKPATVIYIGLIILAIAAILIFRH